MSYRVSLFATEIPPDAKTMLCKALDEKAIGQNEYVTQFENSIANFVGSKFCIATSSGSMSDMIAVAAMKEYYNIERVVVPALTFIAQPNAVRCNNLDVVFADVDIEDNLMYPESVNRSDFNSYPALIFCTDLMGRVAPVKEFQRRGYVVIEDACEAFGSVLDGQHAGTFGELGTFSFFPSHTITTGEGGAIVTDNPTLALLCRSISKHGRCELGEVDPAYKFKFDRFGFNGKMSGLQAVLGLSMMKHLTEFLDKRRFNYAYLQHNIGGFPEQVSESMVPHGFALRFETSSQRDRAMLEFAKAKIETRNLFSCIPMTEPYYMSRNKANKRFPAASRNSLTQLYIPCHHALTREQLDYMITICKDIELAPNSKPKLERKST